MKQWIYHLYKLILVFGAPVSDLRSYITNGSDPWIEWIEDDEFPMGRDGFRYGDIDRLIKNELYYRLKEK